MLYLYFVCAYGFDVGGIIIGTCTALMSGLDCIVCINRFDVGIAGVVCAYRFDVGINLLSDSVLALE
jgi:hypothetical protein